MNKLLITLVASAMTLAASAQTQPMQLDLKQNMYKGKLGLSNVRNLSDTQLKEMSKHNGAIEMPTKAETAKLIKAARKAHQNKGIAKLRADGPADILATGKYKESDFLLKESFEGYTGKFNETPESWTRFSNFDADTYISEADGECPTWMMYETDGYYAPYATDGHFLLLCMNSAEKKGVDGTTVIAPAPDQDEWIVSGTVNNIQATNYLSFDLAFCPLYSHLFAEDPENPKVDLEKLAYDVEVLVTTSTRSASNNEENYTKVFKLSDFVTPMLQKADLTSTEVLTQLMSMRWQHFRVSLADYAGKNIRVAFRYKGKKAGAVLLDAIRVSDLLPIAMYDRPEGSFYLGFSDKAILNYSKTVLMPAYTETTWKNYSNIDCESNVWRYNVNGNSGTSTDYDLTLPAANPSSLNWPTLQANAGLRADEYKGGADVDLGTQGIAHSDHGTAKIGGNAVINYGGEYGNINFSVGNFDSTKQYWLGQLDGVSNAYAFGSGSGTWWSSMTNYEYNMVEGIANVYDAPAAPYVFNTVYLPMGDYFNLGAPIICTVYEAKNLENGGIEVTDNVLGQVTSQVETSVGGAYMLSWNFPNIMTITTPIAISITGFSHSNVLQIAPLSQALNHDNDKGYAFVLLKNSSSNGIWWCEIAGALSAIVGSGNMEISHCIGMNAIFPYLHSNDGDVFTAAEAGETKSFDIDSYWYPKKLEATDNTNGWTIECAESWLTVTPTLDTNAQKAGVDITVQALPAGVPGRTATVTIKALGCEETITVNQGDITAIEGVTMNGFTSAKGTYNISGQRINSKNAKGGLFIENRGGKFVKVVK